MIDPTHDTRSYPPDGGRPIVVLLVDDQAFVGAALGLLLESERDIKLHCCLSAFNAIAMANQIAPTVILQDLIMPDIDGLALVRSFGTNPQTAGTPVIVLSGNDDAATRTRALAEGAKGYLVKLPPKAELIACIRHHASRSAGGNDTLDLTVFGAFLEADAPDFTRLLIDQFLHEACAQVRTLKEAAGRSDSHALNAIAHSLKGSSAIMGASRLAALCGQVEDKSAVTPEVDVTPALIAEIDREFGLVEHALAAQRKGLEQV
jgi:CheY-like chemotaxis protein/HPt (histidine-containing phosphotransfer) domain-containing protein